MTGRKFASWEIEAPSYVSVNFWLISPAKSSNPVTSKWSAIWAILNRAFLLNWLKQQCSSHSFAIEGVKRIDQAKCYLGRVQAPAIWGSNELWSSGHEFKVLNATWIVFEDSQIFFPPEMSYLYICIFFSFSSESKQCSLYWISESVIIQLFKNKS